MIAAVLHRYAGPLALEELDRPSLAPGEVRVRVAASGVNPLDLKIRAGQAAHARPQLPAVLGLDLAGRVEEVGRAVTGFAVGDQVFGLTGGVGGIPGSLAEEAVVDARLLARAPDALSLRESAALPLAFVTAWEGLVDRARVRTGQKVLVHGGAGGVGHVAVQIARAHGAEVFATGSGPSLGVITGLGAVAIDHTAEPVDDYVAKHTEGAGFDVVFDTVGGATLDASFVAARRYEGHVVSALGWGSHSLAPLSFRGATYSGVFTLLPLLTGEGREHHGEILREARRLADAGLLVPRLDERRFDLGTVEGAHALVGSGANVGKVVVEVSSPSAGAAW